MPFTELRRVLSEAVEDSISSLGDSPKQAVFFYLDKSFQIRKENIPTNIDGFTKALETIFGPGAAYLEKLIARRLYEKLGLEFKEAENCNFSEYVNNAKKRLLLKRGQ
ncbi:MAG: hypothetical protein GWO20_19805 [Candidatus Korarchaeota archaeon]|nr:hypothetical protein [Candidatus Korarchaeota archaeon]NIW14215.1 hypothetical protein [Candidatus Thorarchaeota archaeon]